MNLRNLFRFVAVIFMISGLVWLLAPKAMPAATGVEIDAYTAFLYQQLGAINIAQAVLYFLVSGTAQLPARQAVVTFAIVQQALSGILYIPAMLNGVLPTSAALFGVAFSLVLLLAFGYFRFVRPEASVTPGLQS